MYKNKLKMFFIYFFTKIEIIYKSSGTEQKTEVAFMTILRHTRVAEGSWEKKEHLFTQRGARGGRNVTVPSSYFHSCQMAITRPSQSRAPLDSSSAPPCDLAFKIPPPLFA